MSVNPISFKDAIINANHILNKPKQEATSWLGKIVQPLFEKKVYLGYSNDTGWKVYELGFFDQMVRKLNIGYRDTHKELILKKLEDLTAEDASFIPKSQLSKTMPKLKEKLKQIYDQKVSSVQKRSTLKEQMKQHDRISSQKVDASIQENGIQEPRRRLVPPLDLEKLPKGGDGVDDVEVQSVENRLDKSESPRATTPLYLKNYQASRCYIDSVLEVMLSQDSVRQKIFDEYSTVSKACASDLTPTKDKVFLEKKKIILEKLHNLILVVDETKGKGTGEKSPVGKGSPAEQVREAIFASKLNPDLSNLANIYSQQDASAVLLLLNDILDHGTIQTEVEDVGVLDKQTGETVSASRHIDTKKLELRFDGVKADEKIGQLIDQLVPFLLLPEKSNNAQRNKLIDQLLPLLNAKSNPTQDLSDLMNQLKEIKEGSPDLETLTADQLIDLKGTLKKSDLKGMLDQFFTPERAITGKGNEDTRKFTLENGKEVSLPFSTQTKVKNLPDSLALHVSRYTFDLQNMSPGKLLDPVDLPKDGIVDMTPYCGKGSEEYKYEITGYVVHAGGNLGGGHYTSNIKIGDKFYECDDGNPAFHKEISAAEFYGNKNAYLVMLKRVPNKSSSGDAAAAA
jgi:ubiquitin C-terminal hydrolase